MNFKWEKIVEIQYDAMQRLSALYIAIISAIVVFLEKPFSNYYKFFLIFSFCFVLLQSLAVLCLTHIQRKASWKSEHGEDAKKENHLENIIRKFVLSLSFIAMIFIFVTIALIIFQLEGKICAK